MQVIMQVRPLTTLRIAHIKMKNFLKENWFKISVLIICFLSAIYYFSVTVPSRDELVNKIKCQQESKKNLESDSGMFSTADERIFYESRFIPSLNTCLARTTVRGSSIDSVISYTVYSIIDIYTNQVLVSYTKSTGGNRSSAYTSEEAEYYRLSREYFKAL